jgi:hypothetical protein
MKKLIPLLLLALLFTAGCDLTGGPITISTAGQPPVINSFDASPSTISAGESSTLSWNVSGASTVSIDQGIGNVALTGRRDVVPGTTTVYTLTATSAAGASTTATAQVIVSGAPSPSTGLPVVNYFTASPSGIIVGNSVTLSWNVSNATSVAIAPGVGTFASSGTTIVSPMASTTYTLTATNAAGSATAMTQVTVSGAPPSAGLPVVNYFTATPNVIAAGSSTTLSWNVSNATSVTIEPGVGSVGLSGTALVSPATSTSYTLTATNTFGVYYMTIAVLVTGAPPAVPQTVVLAPVANETGSVYSAGSGPVVSTLAGDTSTNASIRAYFSFDISSLAGKDVTNATLAFSTQNIVHNPWPDLTGLWVGTVDYGIGPLQTSDYTLASNPLVGSWLTSVPGAIDVTSVVHSAAAASNPRFQVRCHFAKPTDGDGLADYIMWSTATLTVTYVP